MVKGKNDGNCPIMETSCMYILYSGFNKDLLSKLITEKCTPDFQISTKLLSNQFTKWVEPVKFFYIIFYSKDLYLFTIFIVTSRGPGFAFRSRFSLKALFVVVSISTALLKNLLFQREDTHIVTHIHFQLFCLGSSGAVPFVLNFSVGFLLATSKKRQISNLLNASNNRNNM